jgi:hypothetical protein
MQIEVRTDRHDDANSRFVNAPKKSSEFYYISRLCVLRDYDYDYDNIL